MIYLVSNYRIQGIHYKFEMITDIINMRELRTLPCLCHWLSIMDHSNNFLHFTLNDSMEEFSHPSGIFPLMADKRLVSEFIPTFLLFELMIVNMVCLDVRIWLKFSMVHSHEYSFELYTLNI